MIYCPRCVEQSNAKLELRTDHKRMFPVGRKPRSLHVKDNLHQLPITLVATRTISFLNLRAADSRKVD